MSWKLLLIFTVTFIVSSCGKNRPVIGFMLPNMNAQRYVIEKETFINKANELGADVLFMQANNDDQKQEEQLDELLAKKIDVLVLDPVNRFLAAGMIRKAHSKNIKVISYDRLVANCQIDAFVSFDPVMTGHQMAEAIVKIVPSGNYVILGGDLSDFNAIGINEGLQQYLDPYIKSGKIKIVYKTFIEKWDGEDAAFELSRYIGLSNLFPDAIIAGNDLMAQNVINTLEKYGLTSKIPVTGNGGELSACKNIMAGKQAMTIYKPGKKLAALAVELSLKMLQNENTSDILTSKKNNGFGDIPSRLLETIPIDGAKIMSTVVADGMFKESDLNK